MIKSKNNLEYEYFTENEWKQFQQNLCIAYSVCNKYAINLKCKMFNDIRWPATGLKIASLFKTRYIRIILNHNYLSDKNIFYELRDHTVISIPFIFSKTVNDKLVETISAEQIQDTVLIDNLVSRAIQSKNEHT